MKTRVGRILLHNYGVLVLVFYVASFVLLSSGRIASGDAGQTLQATMVMVRQGRWGSPTLPPRIDLWVKGPDGRYYDCHDIGNVILMLPSAWLAARHSPPADEPPLMARFGVALTYALVSAVGSWYMFRLFALFYRRRTAFLLSLAFSTATIFWAYTKTSWDVMGACVGVAMLLFYTARLLKSPAVRTRDVVWLGASLAIAGSFRYSALPFLLLSTAACLALPPRRLAPRHWLLGAAVFLLGMAPMLAYNEVRMGSLLRPATTAPQFALNSMDGPFWPGFLGLFGSPNRGLLEFAPVFLLLFLLPKVWRTLPRPAQVLSACFGLGSVMYAGMIAKIVNWGAFGWGPRFLLPVVPALFFITGLVIVALWARHRRALIALIAVSAALNAAPVLVNWQLASTEYPHSVYEYARLPYQQMAVWHGLGLALEGKPLPINAEQMTDANSRAVARFPDLWTVRVMEHSTKGLLAGGLITLLLLGTALSSGRRLLAGGRRREFALRPSPVPDAVLAHRH